MTSQSCPVVEDIMLSTRLGVMELTPDMTLDQQENCPCCDSQLQTFCTFTSQLNDQKVRVGVCAECGYSGYIDRLDYKWIINFYKKNWDKVQTRSVDYLRNNFTLTETGLAASRNHIVQTIKNLDIDKSSSILELGTGFGEMLKNLQIAGFSNLTGTENSKHRAELVSEAHGFQVNYGEFENEDNIKDLQKNSPYKVVFSNHVLEHTYHPSNVIKQISRLQQEGDYLILALPNSTGEHINFILHFLVHLHAFSKNSLELLFNKNGYELVEDISIDNFSIIFKAKKVSNPVARLENHKNHVENFKKRVQESTILSNKVKNNSTNYEIFWRYTPENPDFAELQEQKPFWPIRKSLSYLKSRKLNRFANGETFLFNNSGIRKTNPSKSLYEIQFKGPLKLMIK